MTQHHHTASLHICSLYCRNKKEPPWVTGSAPGYITLHSLFASTELYVLQEGIASLGRVCKWQPQYGPDTATVPLLTANYEKQGHKLLYVAIIRLEYPEQQELGEWCRHEFRLRPTWLSMFFWIYGKPAALRKKITRQQCCTCKNNHKIS